MYYIFNKLPPFFFSIILVTSLFVGNAYGHNTLETYYYSDYRDGVGFGCVFMIKISNAKEICVFETSVEKLIQRDYAYLYVYLFDLCRENTGHSMDLQCHVVHHPQFLKRDGIPNTIDYEITSGDESSPPIYYGHGYFDSYDTEYKFTFVYKDTRYLKKFNVTEWDKLE